MNIQVELAIIGLLQAVVVAIIAGLFSRDSRKRKKSLENAETRAGGRRRFFPFPWESGTECFLLQESA